jgi:hypothetical protein
MEQKNPSFIAKSSILWDKPINGKGLSNHGLYLNQPADKSRLYSI